MNSKIKFALGLFFTFLMISFPQVSLAAQCDKLKPGQAAFFEHGKYKGACVVRNIGRYANSKGIGIGNDKISSIKVGPGTQVKICMDNNYKGGCRTYTKNSPSLGKANDKTSSAIIEKILTTKNTSIRCKPNANQVAVYEHKQYKGACAVLGIGNYENSRKIGVANDTISSIRVGKNVALVGFEHIGFRSVTYYTEENRAWMNSDKNRNPSKSSGQGDKISSIKVIRRNK